MKKLLLILIGLVFIIVNVYPQTKYKSGRLITRATNKLEADTTFIDLADFSNYLSGDSVFIAFRPDTIATDTGNYPKVRLICRWYMSYSNVFGEQYNDTIRTQPTSKLLTDSITTFGATSIYTIPMFWKQFKFIKQLYYADTSATIPAGVGINFKELIGIK